MRRLGLTAAGLLLCANLALFGASRTVSAAPPRGPVHHTCSATDRHFISTVQTNVTAIGLWDDQFARGEASARDVLREIRNARARLDATDPTDPSLDKTRELLRAMYSEYSRAVVSKARGKDATDHLLRTYGLANFARDVLVEARDELYDNGCDVGPLL